LAAWHASVFDDGSASPRTQQTLRQLNLADLYAQHPEQVQSRLHAAAVEDPQPDYLFALADITYLLGRASEQPQPSEALVRYYLCAGYAYHFLFHTRGGEQLSARNSFDPRHRLACDLYNAALSKCVRGAQKVGRLDPRHELHLPTPAGEFTLAVDHHGFAWRPEEFGPLLFCCDYN